MVSVYSNRSTTGSFVGSCRNGAVYDLSNHFMGSYRDGKIYNKQIYNSSGSRIGSYNDESIYSYDTSYVGYFGESTVYDLGNQARGECISDKGAHAAALSFSPVATGEEGTWIYLVRARKKPGGITMKKVISIFLAISVLLTCAACGGNSKQHTMSSSGGYLSGGNTSQPSETAEESSSSENTMYLLTMERSFDGEDNLLSKKEHSYFWDGDVLVRILQKGDYFLERKVDLDGTLLSEATYSSDNPDTPDTLSEYTYDGNGVLRSKKYYSSGVLEQDITYHENGDYLEYRQYWGNDGELSTIYKHIYDAHGYMLLDVAYNRDGSVWTWHEYSHYDEKDSLLSEELDESIAAGRIDDVLRSYKAEYSYDTNGYLVYKKEDANRIHKDNSYVVKETKYTNDAWGKPLTEEVFYDGELEEEYKYTYNSDGNILSSESVIRNHHLKLEYTYDSYGNMLSELTQSGEKLNQRNEYTYENIVVSAKDEYSQTPKEKNVFRVCL